MSLGPVMIDLVGLEVNEEERELLQHPHVGGLIFFTRNYRSPEQLKGLVQQVREARSDILICVDHEGGRVQRFREEFSRIPPAGLFGKAFDIDPPRGLEGAKTAGWLMAVELRAFDIDFSFAPVLDLDYGVSAVIGNRAFHSDPNKAFELARAYILGMIEAGMSATGKHFPGHGAVVEDSHLDLPTDHRSLQEILAKDCIPFKRLIDEKLMDGVMPAHVIYAEVDSHPAGFSPIWIKDILRRQIGFDGVVFSDDLNMAAAHVIGSFTHRAHAAIEAGCDMVLVCNNREGAVEILDNLKKTPGTESAQRLVKMRGRLGMSMSDLQAQPVWREAAALMQSFNNT